MSAGTMPKWLGFKLGDMHYAIALDSVLRVYYHPVSQGVSIEAMEGYPVFVVPASGIFSENENMLLSSIADETAPSMNWVVVLKSYEAAKIGFRVERTFGPVIAKEDERLKTFTHDNMCFHVLKLIGGIDG